MLGSLGSHRPNGIVGGRVSEVSSNLLLDMSKVPLGKHGGTDDDTQKYTENTKEPSKVTGVLFG